MIKRKRLNSAFEDALTHHTPDSAPALTHHTPRFLIATPAHCRGSGRLRPSLPRGRCGTHSGLHPPGTTEPRCHGGSRGSAAATRRRNPRGAEREPPCRPRSLTAVPAAPLRNRTAVAAPALTETQQLGARPPIAALAHRARPPSAAIGQRRPPPRSDWLRPPRASGGLVCVRYVRPGRGLVENPRARGRGLRGACGRDHSERGAGGAVRNGHGVGSSEGQAWSGEWPGMAGEGCWTSARAQSCRGQPQLPPPQLVPSLSILPTAAATTPARSKPLHPGHLQSYPPCEAAWTPSATALQPS